MTNLKYALVLVAALLLGAIGCSGEPTTPTTIPIPTSMPGVPAITDFTPLPGLTKNTEVRDRYFEAVYLWKAPEGKTGAQWTSAAGEGFIQFSGSPVESFTQQDGIAIRFDTTDAFVPGMLVSYRLDKRAYQGEGKEEVSLASLVTRPGVYNIFLEAPEDTGDYVVRFFLNGILVENLLFEVK
ncbi:MAG: hypothetical protein HW388_511 [Dehalococcoidia bacterium]|nr:hypothetical protein [Dehalococcoidia bacterium]